ncbi:MAG: hypothetical protein ACRD8O_16080 [Bryobacteraceae bacterium]
MGLTRTNSRVLIGAVVVMTALLMRVWWDYFGPNSIPHQTIQLQLKLFGSSIYEYHAKTGRWPSGFDDLAGTSLPEQNPSWRAMGSTIVIIWRQDLKPDPKANPGVLLAYHNGGLFSQLGRVWVCWGDLSTEYVKDEVLRTLLSTGGK